MSPLEQFCKESGAQRFIYLRGSGIAVDLDECKDLVLLNAAAYQTINDLATAKAASERAAQFLDELKLWLRHGQFVRRRKGVK